VPVSGHRSDANYQRVHRLRIVTYCGIGEAAVIWRERESLDDAVTRGVRRLYLDHGALVSGECRIIVSDPQAIEIESPVRGTDWTRIGVIRCRLDRRDGSLERWFRRVR
jgi:hypothetical protein